MVRNEDTPREKRRMASKGGGPLILSCMLAALTSCVSYGDAARELDSDTEITANESLQLSSDLARESDMSLTGTDIVCESWHHKFRRCVAGFFIGRAYLIEQYSRTNCIKGRNWDNEGIHIWVNDGCRGRFHVDPE